MIDIYTRFAEAVPIKDQSAQVVADAIFNNIVCRYGCPDMVISDRGSNFTSKLFQDACSSLQIKHNITTAYRPCSNSICERFNKTLCGTIARISEGNNRNWDSFISPALFAYNNATHASTNESPAFLLYGFDPRFPIAFPAEPQNISLEKPHGMELRDRLRAVREAAYKLGRQWNFNNRKRINRNREMNNWREGQRVWLLHKGKIKNSGKFSAKYLGPYRITRKLGPVTVEIGDNRKNNKFIVHVDRLKQCYFPMYKDAKKRERNRHLMKPEEEEPINDSNDEDICGYIRHWTRGTNYRTNHPPSEPQDQQNELERLEEDRYPEMRPSQSPQRRYDLRGRRVDYRKLHYGN
ncbi:uncharacterized protein LOC111613248 [Centruroides sculpturatus]|uniref:uncharacterized protein LOC111613248 n=1 Tax=Centruroides sculpturatus TaxID=218467 RepID=UPI000C6E9C20|nr:uncharacterized protein LOC111613248 [Centruroides sculpturatus]